MTSMRVAIYARVSSDQQVEGGTVASQLAALQARLAQDGARLEPACRFVDEGYSGATLVRPGLERLRDLVATGTVDRVYVHAPDRLARRYAYQVLLLEEFRRAGCRVEFFLDGDQYRTVAQAPDYPMQLIIGVFHFPASAAVFATSEVPELTVHRVSGRPN